MEGVRERGMEGVSMRGGGMEGVRERGREGVSKGGMEGVRERGMEGVRGERRRNGGCER